MKFKNIVILIAIVAVISFFIYRQFQNPSVKVKKVYSKTGEVTKSVSASGFVKSNLETEVGFPISGKISKVFLTEGSTVATGSLIAQLTNDDLYFTAESARKDKDSFQRTRDIYKENYQFETSEVGGDSEYELNIKKLTDQLRSADNAYKSRISVLNKSYLYAPMSGTIIYSGIKQGNVVSGATVVKIADLNKLEFQANLDQEDYRDVKPNQVAEIVLDAYPDKKFFGKVVEIPSYIDEESVTKTFKLKISLDNTDSLIVKGMTGDVNIITKNASSARYLPFDAIFAEDEKKYVWVVTNDEKLLKKYIEVGIEGDTFTEIKSELPEFVVTPDSAVKTVKEGFSVLY